MYHNQLKEKLWNISFILSDDADRYEEMPLRLQTVLFPLIHFCFWTAEADVLLSFICWTQEEYSNSICWPQTLAFQAPSETFLEKLHQPYYQLTCSNDLMFLPHIYIYIYYISESSWFCEKRTWNSRWWWSLPKRPPGHATGSLDSAAPGPHQLHMWRQRAGEGGLRRRVPPCGATLWRRLSRCGGEDSTGPQPQPSVHHRGSGRHPL